MIQRQHHIETEPDHAKLIAALEACGTGFNAYARVLFDDPAFRSGEVAEAATLVEVSVGSLGLSEGGVYAEVVARAQAAGLSLCPLSWAADLRLSYRDQPEGPYLTVASPRPREDEHYPRGFYLRHHEGRLWLRGYRASDDWLWTPDQLLAFWR